MKIILSLLKLFLASLVLAAIVTQYLADFQRDSFSSVNFFSYFTIQTSIIAAVSLLFSSYFLFIGKRSASLDLFRGGALVYMIVTGIAYELLLSHIPDTTGTKIEWVNYVLHYILPTLLVFDWFIDRPKRLGFISLAWWLVFPIAYLVYTFVRAGFTGWYPYPFLDPATNGISGIIIYILGIGAGAVVLGLLVIFTSRLLRKDPMT